MPFQIPASADKEIMISIIDTFKGELERQRDSIIPDTLHPMALYKMPAGVDSNVIINLKFKTNDDSDPGRHCYIQLRKVGSSGVNDKNYLYQGYGIAFRPCSNPNDNNLFVVDNGLSSREVVVSHQIITGRGLYSYLTSAYKEILPNTWYYLKMIVNSHNGITVYIWADGQEEPTSPCLIFGAQSEEPDSTADELYWYTPIADYGYDGDKYFGIGVDGCNDNLWYINNIQINYLNLEYSHVGFSFDGANLPDEFDLDIKMAGFGAIDDVQTDGVNTYFWNFLTDHITETGEYTNWDLQTPDITGTSAYKLYSFIDIDKDTYVDEATDRFLVQCVTTYPSNPSAIPLPIYSEISVDYVVLAGALHPGFHIGGKSDIYIKGTLTDSTADVPISENGYINIDESFNLPVAIIDRIVILGLESEELLDVDSWEYQILSWPNRYSTKDTWERIKVENGYEGNNARVYYSYFSGVKGLQDYIDGTDKKEPCRDYSVFNFVPWYISFDITYTGEVSTDTFDTLLRTYITNSTSRIEYLKILDIFMDQDVTPDLSNFTITCKRIDKKGVETIYDLGTEKYIDFSENERPFVESIILAKT